VLGGAPVVLPTGEKHDPGHGGRHVPTEDAEGRRRDLGHRRRLGTLRSRDDHVRLQEYPLERHSLRRQRAEDDGARDLAGAGERMRSVHGDLGLHDRNQPLFLAECRITAEGVRIRLQAGVAGESVAHSDHGPPLRGARAQRPVVLEAVPEAVQPLGHGLPGTGGQGLGAGVDLDARDDPGANKHLGQRAGAAGLPDGLLVMITPLTNSDRPGVVKRISR
jgi:hypothetical protein